MIRVRVLALAIVACLAAALPAVASHTTTNSFTVTGPGAGTYRATVKITWKWTGDSTFRKEVVQLSTVQGMNVRLIATVPIWWNRYYWNTAPWTDGTYRVQGVVVGTNPIMRSFTDGVRLDNTAPQPEVTRPAEGDVIAADQVVHSGAPATVVAGTVTLGADATDNLSGVSTVVLLVDDEMMDSATSCADANRLSCEGTASHTFGLMPGEHTVAARACDLVGNCATSESVVVDVGTSAGDVPDDVCAQGTCVLPEGDPGAEPPEQPEPPQPGDQVCALDQCVTIPDPATIDPTCVVTTTDPNCLLG